jgi:DNA invertase Pin-like site-specific DNA recombinase
MERLDRRARDLMVQESIVADFKRKGLSIISVNEPDLCSDDPSRILMRQMLGAFFQYEKTLLVAKLKGARIRAKAVNGTCEDRKPYGARPGEDQVIERIMALRAKGTAMDTIAETLLLAGVIVRAFVEQDALGAVCPGKVRAFPACSKAILILLSG